MGMNRDAMASLLRYLVNLRTRSIGVDRDGYRCMLDMGRFWGFVQALQDMGVIDCVQAARLDVLADNCHQHGDKPFPSLRNAGPVMTAYDEWMRDREVVKLQAQEPANEKPEPVPAPAACGRVPVQRVLVSPYHVLTRFCGQPAPRPNRAAFPRLHPCWSPVLAVRQMVGRARQLRLSLGPTKVPCALLGGGGKPGKARALRAHSRAF